MSAIVAAKAAKKAQPMIEEIKPYIVPALGVTAIGALVVGGYFVYVKFIKPLADIPGDIAGIPEFLVTETTEAATTVADAINQKDVKAQLDIAYAKALEARDIQIWNAAVDEAASGMSFLESINPVARAQHTSLMLWIKNKTTELEAAINQALVDKAVEDAQIMAAEESQRIADETAAMKLQIEENKRLAALAAEQARIDAEAEAAAQLLNEQQEAAALKRQRDAAAMAARRAAAERLAAEEAARLALEAEQQALLDAQQRERSLQKILQFEEQIIQTQVETQRIRTGGK